MIIMQVTDTEVGEFYDMEDPNEINALANKIIKKYSFDYNESVTLIKVLDAKKRTTTGTDYNFVLQTIVLPCPTKQCAKNITATIFSQPWTNTEDINILNVSDFYEIKN
uniref:Cystatin domain-containing protein n=1 Tax=Parastrongyloides trichosuri TaxID=131310 RepID=A0A0N4ZDD2_PARTI